MSKCSACGASWSQTGMSQCPICGKNVEVSADAASSTRRRGATATLLAPVERDSSVAVATATTPPEPHLEPHAEVPPSPVDLLPKPPEKHNELVVDPPELPKLQPLSRVSTRPKDSTLGMPREMESLPRPARPLNGPLILGILALVTGLMLPVTIYFESNPIMGIMGFCLAGVFVPFSPIAWIAGLAAEKRRREQGLRPERRVVIGRVLGQLGTLLLVFEVTAVLLLIAGLRLAGKLPSSFWSGPC